MLADFQIQQLCINDGLITPFNQDLLQPASYDLTLGGMYALVTNNGKPLFVGEETPHYTYKEFPGDNVILRRQAFALFQTRETLLVPNDIGAKFEGKSSLGRIGLMTHVTAGFIDPGFNGVLTLELYNCGPLDLVLTLGIKIGQVSFTKLDGMVDRPYGSDGLNSHYQGNESVQGGLFHDDKAGQDTPNDQGTVD